MRSAVTARTRYLLATALVISLIGGLLATTIDLAPASGNSPMAPNFFTFSGSPFDDGLNHYLVSLDAAATVEGDELLRLANEGNLEFGEAGVVTSVTAEELAAIIAGGTSNVSAASVVAAHPDIVSLRPLGFDLYAAAGTIGLDEIRQLTGVALAEIDSRLATASADPLYPSQWSLENDGETAEPWAVNADADIDAPEGWHRTRGAGVIVAVIDSGVDVSHPDLAANVWHNAGEVCDNEIDDDANGYTDDCVGWDFINDDNTPEDVNGHGTHVAGIIAAEADNLIGIAGVAYESQVMALKIGDGSPPLSAAIEAFAYAIENGARIINASWVSDDPAAAAFLQPALDAAAAAGVLVVTGAGNYGTDIDSEPVYPASMAHDNLIAVGASTPQDQPAEYSGYGRRSVDLFAPGEHIVSTLPGGGYGVYSGTSMAAPMVSGAAALLWAATPKATYAEVKGALLDLSDGPNDGVSAFRSLSASDGRLNIERSIYTRLFQPSLMYTFHDFNSFEPSVAHDVTIVAKTVDPWIAPPQTPARYRLGLYVPYEGQPMAVVGHPVFHTYGGATTDAVTDGTGRALVGPVWEREERSVLVQGGDPTELNMSLPMGTYAVTLEVVDVTDPGNPQTMGEPSAVFFVVGIDGSVTQMPDNPIGGTTPTTTFAPVTTTSDPSSGSTTTAPNSSTTSSSTTSVVPGDPNSSTTTTTTAGPEDPEDPTAASTTTTTTEPPTTVLPSTTTTSTTSTTEAPTTSTTEPGTTESTTTTTTSTAPTTTVVDPDEMRITEVHPNEGPTAGGTLVTITGKNFPDLPLVDFGDTRGGSIISSTDKFIVLPSPRGTAGYVDVTVTDRATEGVATYPDGFLYTDDEPGSVTTTTEVTVTSGPPSSTTSSAPSPPSSTNPPSNGGSIDDWLGAVLVTPEGLTLAPPSPDDPINAVPVERWAGELCNEPVCPGWVLEG